LRSPGRSSAPPIGPPHPESTAGFGVGSRLGNAVGRRNPSSAAKRSVPSAAVDPFRQDGFLERPASSSPSVLEDLERRPVGVGHRPVPVEPSTRARDVETLLLARSASARLSAPPAALRTPRCRQDPPTTPQNYRGGTSVVRWSQARRPVSSVLVQPVVQDAGFSRQKHPLVGVSDPPLSERAGTRPGASCPRTSAALWTCAFCSVRDPVGLIRVGSRAARGSVLLGCRAVRKGGRRALLADRAWALGGADVPYRNRGDGGRQEACRTDR